MRTRASLRPRFVFAAKFLGALVILYVVVTLGPVNDAVIVPFTAAIAKIAVAAVHVVDGNVHAIGTAMASERFTMDVRNGCNAVETMMLFAAAVLAFPASGRWRAIGVAIGLPLIQAANIVRLATLYWIGSRRPAWFEVFHIGVWQTIIILFGVGIFAVWSARSAASMAARRA
jgi:exosortase H (IPTLxxWG-CTERM-specific)